MESKAVVLAFVALLASSGVVHSDDGEGVFNKLATLSGLQLEYISTAQKEFERRGGDIGAYKTTLIRDRCEYIVLFEDPKTPLSQRGFSPNMPSFEVSMDARFRVIVALLGITSSGWAWPTDGDERDVLVSMPGEYVKYFQIALQKHESYGRNFQECEASLIRKKDGYVVICSGDPLIRGGGFEVRINDDDEVTVRFTR